MARDGAAMPKCTRYPGQAEKLTFSREQLMALASAPRSQVLWAFNESEPLSVAEVATIIGKSPQSVHYHVNTLADLGLLLPVETRKKRSREEKAYVHAARGLFTPAPPIPKGYADPLSSGFAAIMRQAIREKTLVLRVLEEDASIQPFNAFRTCNAMISAEDAQAIKTMLYDSLERANQMGKSEGVRVTMTVLMLPAVGESAAWYERATGKPIPDQAEE